VKIQAVPGFKDILPEECARWRRVERVARDVFARFGCQEIRLPLLEKTELFARSIGETSDIVEKEMYTFPDKGITLRPEATASLLRAFIEHGLHLRGAVQRLFTIGPMFRHERPQKGRLRQFHQLDVEVIGSDAAAVDAEVMAMGAMLLDELGLHASLEINSLGCPDCRPAYREALIGFLGGRIEALCADCQRRLERNPLRVLDCKQPGCREVAQETPSILDHLCRGCRDHFQAVQDHLAGFGVAWRVNRFMVRGLDYYCRTTFEFLSDRLGAQSAVGAGGRYDGLVRDLGGPDLPAIGFALGMERLILLLDEAVGAGGLPPTSGPDLFVAALGTEASGWAMQLTQRLRALGVRVLMDHEGRSLKAQMKQAGRSGARYTLILGSEELARGEAQLKDMAASTQASWPLAASPADTAPELARRILPTSRAS